MEDKTRKLIYAIKEGQTVDYDATVKNFMSLYTGNPVERYTETQLNLIAKMAFIDFLETTDNPSSIVLEFLNKLESKTIDEITSADIRQCIFNVLNYVKVYYDGKYVNGFIQYRLTQFEYDYLKQCKEQFPSLDYIARNEDGSLNIYQVLSENQPLEKHAGIWDGYYKRQPIIFKNMFKFISFEDAQPYKIDDILKYCEIIDD